MASTGTATVMFTDLVDSTGLRSRLGDETADAVRRTHDTVLRSAVEAHGGRLVKGLGDGGMATFSSAADAVATAVAVQQGVDVHNRRSADMRIDLRIGLSAGDVLWEGGDCFGRPVIEAARLCAEAGAGEVLVSDVVRLLGRSADGSRFQARGLRELRGLDVPVDTHELVWEPLSTLPTAAGQPELPELLERGGQLGFRGREEQLAGALHVWKCALAGERQALLLAGEPGIGKTRLAGELAVLTHRQGAAVLYGRCEESLGAPYQPFAEALDHQLRTVPAEDLRSQLGRYPEELTRLVPALAAALPDLGDPLSSDAETERYRLFEAIASWLSTTAADRGLVVVLDDLHWATRPTLVLLQHVLHATTRARLLLVGTYRDTDLSRTHPLSALLADLRRAPDVTRVSLGGLDVEGVAAILADAAGHELDEEGQALAVAVHGETEGNPFFVGEVLRHLRETKAVYQEDGRWVSDRTVAQLGIPEGIREVVGRRLDHLSADANAVLPVAAVIGRDFSLELLARSAGLSEDVVVSGLDEATQARLVDETGVGCYRFSHALVRSTLYEELSVTKRARVHARVAAELEQSAPDDLVALAHHYAAATVAGDLHKAAAYSARAGDAAMEQLAHDQAVVYYTQSLELLGEATDVPVGTRTETLLALGEAQRRSGHAAYRETLLEAARAAREAGDTPRLVRAALGNSRGFWSMAGQVDRDRIEVLEAALDQLGDAVTPERARLLARLAVELMFSDDRALRDRLSAEAVAVARSTGDALALADVLAAAAPAEYTPWTIEQAEEWVIELRELVPALNDPYRLAMAHLWAFIASFFASRDPDETVEELMHAERLTTELAQPTLQWLTGVWRTCYLQTRGRIDEALALVHETLEAGQGSGQPDAWTWYAAQLTTLYRESGRLVELLDAIEDEARNNPGLPAWQVVRAQALLEAGRTDDAREVLRGLVAPGSRTVGLPQDIMWFFGVAALSAVAADLGELDVVALMYDELLPFRHLSVHGGLVFFGAAEHWLGVAATALGRHDRALEHLEAALATHERLRAQVYLGLSHAELARLLTLRGDTERAEQSVALARALAEETGGASILSRLP